MLASIEMSDAPKGQRSVRDILNIMHDMPSTLNDIGISARTVDAARAAKVAAWKVMLQDWRDVGPQTMLWTADRDEHARELATQQQDFNENPFSDEHLQIRWAMMAKSELQPYFLFLQEQIKDITSSSKTSPSAIHMCIAIHTQAWSSLRVEGLRSNWAVLHPNQIVADDEPGAAAGLTGRAASLLSGPCGRGVLLERAHRRSPPLPRTCRVSWWLCCSS